MQRVVIYGNGGSGKSTLARRIADRLGVDHVEIDELTHDAGYVFVGHATVRERTADAITAAGWVIEGINRDALGAALSVADTFIWLDVRRARSGMRLLRRTIGLAVSRRERHGRRVSLRSIIGRELPFILKTARSHGRRRGYAQRFAEDASRRGLDVVTLRSPAEVRRWFGAVPMSEPFPGSCEGGA